MVITNMDSLLNLFGSYDENIKIIQTELGVDILSRGSDIRITGADRAVEKAYTCINSLLKVAERGESISAQQVRYFISMAGESDPEEIAGLSDGGICVTTSGKIIKPKTIGQKKYIDSIESNTISFGVGPAGTGKTFLAVSMAVRAFKAKTVNKIILTRPAVEAGEKLGFLPGDGRPIPQTALRRALRDARGGEFCEAPGARHYRGRSARIYARADAGRLLYHFG